MAGDLFCFCFECQEALGHPDAETAEEALTRRLTARENSTDRHFLQGFLPLLGDLNNLALSSMPACWPLTVN